MMNSVDAWNGESFLPLNNFHAVVSCEHAGNRVPPNYQYLFKGKTKLLESHRGYDIGARLLGRQIADAIAATFHYSNYTRLLIDLNRSPNSRSLFSSITCILNRETKEKIRHQYYDPFRDTLYQEVSEAISDDQSVLHFSIHTFTPRFKGRVRKCDVGVLYDPTRPLEKKIGRFLVQSIGIQLPLLTVRCNYPYRGTADGMVTFLRSQMPVNRYVGIELEVNQKYPKELPKIWQQVRKAIVESISIVRSDFIPEKKKMDGRNGNR